MLVLQRKTGESITLTGELTQGQEIVVSVYEIRHGDKVRLTFAAPNGVKISRTELLTEGISVATTRRESGGRKAKPE